MTLRINGVAVPGVASVSFVEPPAASPPARPFTPPFGGTMTITFLADGHQRVVALIRRAERKARTLQRNLRRVGQGAKRAHRRRVLGAARRLVQRAARSYPGNPTRPVQARQVRAIVGRRGPPVTTRPVGGSRHGCAASTPAS